MKIKFLASLKNPSRSATQSGPYLRSRDSRQKRRGCAPFLPARRSQREQQRVNSLPSLDQFSGVYSSSTVCGQGPKNTLKRGVLREFGENGRHSSKISPRRCRRFNRRHLSGHGRTPEEYRQRYGLRADYPMVSESYSETRRAMAKKIGLGRKPGVKTGKRAPKAKAAAG